ncbi:hypothetical protein [Pedobacter nutrimenti]|uniref:hypothetical protein n=1 Tax=Pedobacter nutrimenti TaxID=1241337 RepID=UPI00292FADBE|nr:hypothetical protein [Pedobacter nutrimenti]
MSFEIHIYLGSACITEKSKHKYPVGEKHAFLFYLKQDKNSEYAPLQAEDIIAELGFSNIEFSRVGKVSPDRIEHGDKKDYYDNAIEQGSTFVLYEDPM